MTAVIQAQGVSFAYGHGELRKTILHDVSFEVAAGEIVLLTGPSGSGKTTMLTLIGALRSMQAGSLCVLGQELAAASAGDCVRLRRRIGFIFQTHNLLGFLPALENVRQALELHPEIPASQRGERAAAALACVGLEAKLHSYPHQLSVGQRQRVAVARALVGEPELILADEPTAALDSQTGAEVVALLERLARDQRRPVLMVTHDSRVLSVADRVLRMEDGRLAS